jgi:hypothetical protein
MRFSLRFITRPFSYIVIFGPAACCAPALWAPAMAVEATVPCTSSQFGGVNACVVEMAAYASDAAGTSVCPAGVKTTGASAVCEESFGVALHDAALFFQQPANAQSTYVIHIGAGTYDFSTEAPLPNQSGAINIHGIAPGGTGCLQNGLAPGQMALSGSGCLIITGDGPANTTLVTPYGTTGMWGAGVSHVLIENMTMQQANMSTTQGVYVSEGTKTVMGAAFPTITMDIAPGMPSPLDLYKISCTRSGNPGCTRIHALSSNPIYARAYTNTVPPRLIDSTSAADLNGQQAMTRPSLMQKAIAALPPMQPDAANYPHRWTVTMSTSSTHHDIPSYYSGTTNGVANLICIKTDSSEAFWFDDRATGGTDVIMNNMVWQGAGRGVFRGISGLAGGGGLGAQVYNSSIERLPNANGQNCLASQAGGVQMGQPGDPPIFGNLIYNFHADGTGDDSIAFFNDIGGTLAPDGSTYPVTSVLESTISNSFARDILLMNDHRNSGVKGKLKVFVDAPTRAYIEANGHCDTLLLGAGNCPVTYSND